MTILVTGASGFVGRHLVKELLRRRKKVRCFMRSSGGDITDKESLIKAVKGVRAVVHLVAVIGSADYKLNYKTHVEGAKNLIDACKASNVKRLIVVSTVATLAKRRSAYGITKAMADELFMKSGLGVTILKPDFIYGVDGRGFMALVNVIKGRRFVPIIGDGRNRRQPVHVDDVVAAIISSLKNKKSTGKTYIVASEKPLEFNTMVDMIMAHLGIEKRKIHLPMTAAMLLAAAMKISRRTVLTKTVVLGISQDCSYDVSPMIRELGVRPRSFGRGLKEVLYSELRK